MRPAITGTAPVGSTVTLYDGDGTTVLGTAVATAGIYSITTSLLAEGTHNLTVKATDYAGNVSAYSPALTLTIDATAPTTTVSGLHLADDTGIDGDFVTTVAGQTLSGTLSAPLGVGERLFGSADSGTTWTDVTAMVSGTNLGWSGITLAGNNSLQLRVTDAAGNVGPTATQGYTLDTSPPLATTPVTTPVATATDPNTLATTVGIPATDPTTPTNPFPAPAATNTVYRFFDSTHGTQFLTSNPAERDTIMATRPDLAYEGKAMGSVDADPNNPNVAPVYRFFDGSNGTHFFTTSAGERDQILNTRHDMVLEQANLFEHATQQSGDVAVYRFFEKTDGSHFFTSDQGEIAAITQHRPDMVAEGKSFYAPKV